MDIKAAINGVKIGDRDVDMKPCFNATIAPPSRSRYASYKYLQALSLELHSENMASSPADDKAERKRLKISAGNGCHTTALWDGKFPLPKPFGTKRLSLTKLKLNELPTLPLDILYEVSIKF